MFCLQIHDNERNIFCIVRGYTLIQQVRVFEKKTRALQSLTHLIYNLLFARKYGNTVLLIAIHTRKITFLLSLLTSTVSIAMLQFVCLFVLLGIA